MSEMKAPLLLAACNEELLNIGGWWVKHAQDQEHGGFFGEIAVDNTPNPTAEKGIILNARILWFFSEAALFTGNAQYKTCADRAYQYLLGYFLDKEHGGFYWSLDCLGQVANSKKQVYGQAFAIYGLSAYYALTKKQEALNQAMACFELVESHCVDHEKIGYFEAYTREWGKIEDVRLSEKDLNSPKTMNTHLHIVEAYTALFNVSSDAKVGSALRYGIECFNKYIIDHDTGHLRMFFGDDWRDQSTTLSYGHDIECSWLLWKASKALCDKSLQRKLKPLVIQMATVCMGQAVGKFGDAVDAYDWVADHLHEERLWWVQAEALVGYLNAYVLTNDHAYLKTAENVWTFIKTHQLDVNNGEWLWYSSLDEIDDARDYKAGFWKGPYHNGRAMIEAVRLLNSD